MEIAIADIEIPPRYRRAITGIEELANSIENVGLLQPIVLTPDYGPSMTKIPAGWISSSRNQWLSVRLLPKLTGPRRKRKRNPGRGPTIAAGEEKRKTLGQLAPGFHETKPPARMSKRHRLPE